MNECKEPKVLLPCPFCGGEAHTFCNDVQGWSIHCMECEQQFMQPTEDITIKQWNTRPVEDVLRAENTKLKQELYDRTCGIRTDPFTGEVYKTIDLQSANKKGNR